MNRCSSNIAAVGLSAGFLSKQHRKKSLPSDDSVSGIDGVSFITLNIAATCIIMHKFEGETAIECEIMDHLFLKV